MTLQGQTYYYGMMTESVLLTQSYSMFAISYHVGLKLYRNGALDDTELTPAPKNVSAPSNQLTFATLRPGHSKFANAAIDELHIFHKIISNSDITYLYNK